MRKRKGDSKISESSISREMDNEIAKQYEMDDDDDVVLKDNGPKFFACYLLTSLSPRHKGHTYIGYTVNPRRRIKQHNGEMRCGAYRTKTKRPWEMVLCIYGFPTNVAALQFEWAWQHPIESLAVRKAAANFKSLGGLANKVKMAFTMLTLPTWESLHLTVNFFSTKYTKFSAGSPTLPEHMRIQVSSMDELPCYTDTPYSIDDNEDAWDEEEECETGRNCTYVEEGLTNVAVNSSVDHQETTRDAIDENNGWIGEIGMKQSLDLLSSKNCQRRSNRDGNSQGQVSSSFVTRTSGASKSSENRDMCSLNEEHRVALDLLTTKYSPVISVSSKVTNEQEGLIDEIGRAQLRELRNSENNFKRSVCSSNLEVQTSGASEKSENRNVFQLNDDRVALDLPARKYSPTIAAFDEDEPSSKSRSYNLEVQTSGASESSEDRNMFSSNEDRFALNSPAWKHSPTIAVDEDEPSSKSCSFPHEVEIIDLLSPSPSYRTNTHSKKRRVSTVCPEIIDLTKSPIFV